MWTEILQKWKNTVTLRFRSHIRQLLSKCVVQWTVATWRNGWALHVSVDCLKSNHHLFKWIKCNKNFHSIRAVENAFIFQRKTDNYGKLYSLIPEFAKYFPKWSDYEAGRDSSIELYTFFSVNICFSFNLNCDSAFELNSTYFFTESYKERSQNVRSIAWSTLYRYVYQ